MSFRRSSSYSSIFSVCNTVSYCFVQCGSVMVYCRLFLAAAKLIMLSVAVAASSPELIMDFIMYLMCMLSHCHASNLGSFKAISSEYVISV